MPVLRAFPARSVVALLFLVGCPRPQIVAGPPPDPGALYIEAKNVGNMPEAQYLVQPWRVAQYNLYGAVVNFGIKGAF